jgi:hypothetical protein
MAKTFKDSLNASNPNQLADLLRELKLGDLVCALPRCLNKQAPIAGALANGNLTTVSIIKLPDDAKAAYVHRAAVRAATAATGEFASATPHYGDTPSTTEVAITPNGDICFLATDVVTDVDVVYTPMKGEVVEFEGDIATGVMAIPPALVARGVLYLLSAEITSGAVLGPKRVLVPLAGGGAGLPATTTVQLTSNKSTVSFNNATDAGTKGKAKVLVSADPEFGAKLASAAKY